MVLRKRILLSEGERDKRHIKCTKADKKQLPPVSFTNDGPADAVGAVRVAAAPSTSSALPASSSSGSSASSALSSVTSSISSSLVISTASSATSTLLTSTIASPSSTPGGLSPPYSCPSVNGQTVTDPAGGTYEVGCDRDASGGNQIQDVRSPDGTINGCMDLCTQNPQCIAWSFIANNSYCYLKVSVTSNKFSLQ